jgi:hypothetical protein
VWVDFGKIARLPFTVDKTRAQYLKVVGGFDKSRSAEHKKRCLLRITTPRNRHTVMDRQRLGFNNVSVEQPRNLRHGHRLLFKGHVHRLQSARPNPRKVLVQHARLQVTGALH